jgi:hypothetical protein
MPFSPFALPPVSLVQENGISTPRHVFLNDEERGAGVVVENDDWVEIKGVRFNKPIVEKPVRRCCDPNDDFHDTYRNSGLAFIGLYRCISFRTFFVMLTP